MILIIMQEYEERSTPEARFVKGRRELLRPEIHFL